MKNSRSTKQTTLNTIKKPQLTNYAMNEVNLGLKVGMSNTLFSDNNYDEEEFLWGLNFCMIFFVINVYLTSKSARKIIKSRSTTYNENTKCRTKTFIILFGYLPWNYPWCSWLSLLHFLARSSLFRTLDWIAGRPFWGFYFRLSARTPLYRSIYTISSIFISSWSTVMSLSLSL